eukprot:CAMPEP_0170498856 /NCGR_PEP_ID=MMETSP0208-20121228/29197_1 /TAXON_ID=197538 /ORGANISM="Strombidium inclinatum, Strain S3" /LENGTH=177 /DNA_ID=CAMNT_0010776167 /DNA_START=795 /DNA_END=1327 /DNA_ORIENTATION=-
MAKNSLNSRERRAVHRIHPDKSLAKYGDNVIHEEDRRPPVVVAGREQAVVLSPCGAIAHPEDDFLKAEEAEQNGWLHLEPFEEDYFPEVITEALEGPKLPMRVDLLKVSGNLYRLQESCKEKEAVDEEVEQSDDHPDGLVGGYHVDLFHPVLPDQVYLDQACEQHDDAKQARCSKAF